MVGVSVGVRVLRKQAKELLVYIHLISLVSIAKHDAYGFSRETLLFPPVYNNDPMPPQYTERSYQGDRWFEIKTK